MKTDNVLVSREKWEAMLGILELLCSYDIPCTDNTSKSSRKILSMPDFIESERDVEVVTRAMNPYSQVMRNKTYASNAQAAINALRYIKEGE